MPNIVGLDLSMTSTGVAILSGTRVLVDRIRSKPPVTPRNPRTGKPEPPTLGQRADRLAVLKRQIVLAVLGNDFGPELVVVEGPSYGSEGAAAHDRSGLWWLVVHWLDEQGIPYAEVPPKTRAKYGTGNGASGKDEVLACVIRRYIDVEVRGNDEADALLLAAMGARWLGHPIDDLPKAHLDAMTKVRWPDRPALGGAA